MAGTLAELVNTVDGKKPVSEIVARDKHECDTEHFLGENEASMDVVVIVAL